MTAHPLSRRDVLRGGIAGLVVLASCRKRASDAVFTCTDTSAVEPASVQARTAVGYIDRATDPTKTCADCQQFVAAPNDGACGSCKVVRGPIHPGGSCKAFTAKS